VVGGAGSLEQGGSALRAFCGRVRGAVDARARVPRAGAMGGGEAGCYTARDEAGGQHATRRTHIDKVCLHALTLPGCSLS
jgi:hypothetical protein